MFLIETDKKVMRKICFYVPINAQISTYILYLYPSNHYIHIYNVYNNSYNEIILLSIFYIYHILFNRYVLDYRKNTNKSRLTRNFAHNRITKPSKTSFKKASNVRTKHCLKPYNIILALGTFLSSISIGNAQIRAFKKIYAFLHGFKMSLNGLQNQFLDIIKSTATI